MNKAILMGRLTNDPEIRVTEGAEHYTIARFTIAVDRRVAKGDAKADFIRVQAWNKKAEFARDYLRKGIKVIVSGRIATDSYKNKDGVTVYTTDIVAEDIEFCESKKAADEGNATVAPDFTEVPASIEEELPFN